MSKGMSAGRVRKAYQFIEAHRRDYPVQIMCQVLREDARLLRLIRASFVASHGIYGAPRVFWTCEKLVRPAASIESSD